MVNQPFPNHVWSFIIYFDLICQYPLASAQDEEKTMHIYVYENKNNCLPEKEKAEGNVT